MNERIYNSPPTTVKSIANYKPPTGLATLLRVATVHPTEYSGQSVARVQAVTGCLLLPSIQREQGTG